MEVSLPLQFHHCNCFTKPTYSPSSFYRPASLNLRTSGSSSSGGGSRIITPRRKQEEVAARDMMIDFGRYKGKMLGTLPSTYLKWVSNNLRARDFEHWAILADQVLADPIYKDRIEWEFAQNILNGNDVMAKSIMTTISIGGVGELLAEISERYEWDNDDKLGWGKIDFALLGTSKGNPIPRRRRPTPKEEEEILTIKKENLGAGKNGDSSSSNKRSERRERLRRRWSSGGGGDKEKKTTTRFGFGVVNEEEGSVGDNDQVKMMINNKHDYPSVISPCLFPGRQSLLDKKAFMKQTNKQIEIKGISYKT